MAPLRFLLPNVRALDDARAELCACSMFTDERPMRGVAALLDWRLAGKLSALAKDGYLSGREGEVVMVPGRPRLPFEKIVLFGLGERARFDDAAFGRYLERLQQALGGLNVRRAVVELAGRTSISMSSARRADLLAERAFGPEALERVVFVEDEEGQRSIVQAFKRSELRARSA